MLMAIPALSTTPVKSWPVNCDQWQRALAHALGPLHPQGPRERIDDRLVRRWAAQEQGRDIPGWVLGALRSIAESRASELQDLLQRLPPKDVP